MLIIYSVCSNNTVIFTTYNTICSFITRNTILSTCTYKSITRTIRITYTTNNNCVGTTSIILTSTSYKDMGTISINGILITSYNNTFGITIPIYYIFTTPSYKGPTLTYLIFLATYYRWKFSALICVASTIKSYLINLLIYNDA